MTYIYRGDIYQIIKSIAAPKKPEKLNYVLKKKLLSYLELKKNVITERFRFYIDSQKTMNRLVITLSNLRLCRNRMSLRNF